MIKFARRLIFAYVVERICQKIYPTKLIELTFEGPQWRKLQLTAASYAMTPEEYVRHSIQSLARSMREAGL